MDVATALALPDTAVVEVVFNAIGNAAIFIGGIALAGYWPLVARGSRVDDARAG